MDLPNPLAICLEHTDAKDLATRYLTCVALVGKGPGLTLDASGEVSWMGQDSKHVGLWVSGDARLMAHRPSGSPPLAVHRGGRFLQAPEDKPVVLLDQDEIQVGPKRFTVHIHGEVDQGHEPVYFDPSASDGSEAQVTEDPGVADPSEDRRAGGKLLRATAAALALSTAMGASACTDPKSKSPKANGEDKEREGGGTNREGREGKPPGPRARWVDHGAADAGLSGPKDRPPKKKARKNKEPRPPIDVRVHPPSIAAPRPPTTKPRKPLKPRKP